MRPPLLRSLPSPAAPGRSWRAVTGVRLWTCLLVLGLPLGSAVAQEDEAPPPEGLTPPPVPAAATPARLDTGPEWRTRWGASVVAGTPQGLGAVLLVEPRPWLRVQAGGGRNSLGAGVLAGVELLPIHLLLSPVLGLEYSHFFREDYARLLSRLHGEPTAPVTDIRQVDDDQLSLYGGLEYSPWRPLSVFAGAGISFGFIGVRDARAFIREAADSPDVTATPLLLTFTTPVARLGLRVYFN